MGHEAGVEAYHAWPKQDIEAQMAVLHRINQDLTESGALSQNDCQPKMAEGAPVSTRQQKYGHSKLWKSLFEKQCRKPDPIIWRPKKRRANPNLSILFGQSRYHDDVGVRLPRPDHARHVDARWR